VKERIRGINTCHPLCNQAAESDPARLDQKVIHAEPRKIYDSFRNPKRQTAKLVCPAMFLGPLRPGAEFDFEGHHFP